MLTILQFMLEYLLRYVPLTSKRMTGIVSRGGSIMANGALLIIAKTFSTSTGMKYARLWHPMMSPFRLAMV